MKTKLKPFNVYAEITRVNKAERTVEAYAFVNEVVEGEGGVRLKRSSMEAATPDYMKWANIRRMHGKDAVGVARSVEWDETGAKMILEVVDDDAWKKVERGVYKGLSIGVASCVMRGKDVESCRWIETSLVDRPADPDAKIMTFRAEGVGEDETEFETDVEEIRTEEPELVRSAEAEVTTGSVVEVERVDETPATDAPETVELSRFAALETERDALLERAVTAETELERVQASVTVIETERDAALERVEFLSKLPAVPLKLPVRNPAQYDRTFAANEGKGEPLGETLIDEYSRISTPVEGATDDQKMATVQRMQMIKVKLAEIGVRL